MKIRGFESLRREKSGQSAENKGRQLRLWPKDAVDEDCSGEGDHLTGGRCVSRWTILGCEHGLL